MAEIEISIESGEEYKCCDCACCKNCPECQMEDSGASKDQMLAELKKLLNESSQNNVAERQAKIDDLMEKISEAD